MTALLDTNTQTLTVDVADLRAALVAVKPAISRQSYQVPALQSVRIGDGEVKATDLDLTISAILPGAVMFPGALAPHAALLAALPTARKALVGNVTLTWAGSSLTVEHNGNSATMATADVTTYPRVSTVGGTDGPLDLVALASVASAMSKEESRPVLCSVLVDGSTMAATDSYRLHVVDNTATTLEGKALLPRALVSAVLKAKPAKASIRVGQYDAAVTTDTGTVYAARLCDATFPNFRQLIPADPASAVTFNHAALVAVLADVKRMKLDKATPVRLAEGETLVVSVQQRDDVSMTRSIIGSAMHTVAFNPTYLADALDGAETNMLRQHDSNKPALLSWTDAEGRSHLRLLMPVRIG